VNAKLIVALPLPREKHALIIRHKAGYMMCC